MMFEYFKRYWDWADQNPEDVNATSAAMYFYFLHLANTLRWRDSFGVTAGQTMAAIGIGSVKTYRKHFEELIKFGLIEIKKRSINQYSCHVIALPKITQPTTQAGVDHVPKQGSGIYLSDDLSTDPIHKTNKTSKDSKENKDNEDSGVSKETKPKSYKQWTLDDFKQSIADNRLDYPKDMLNSFFSYWSELNISGKPKFTAQPTWETPKRLKRWFDNNSKFTSSKPQQVSFNRSSTEHYK